MAAECVSVPQVGACREKSSWILGSILTLGRVYVYGYCTGKNLYNNHYSLMILETTFAAILPWPLRNCKFEKFCMTCAQFCMTTNMATSEYRI